MNKIHIDEILKNWGKNNQKIPVNNSALKKEILSKIISQRQYMQTRRSIPWMALTFASMAVLFILVDISNLNLNSQNSVTGVYKINGGVQTISYPEIPESNMAPRDSSISAQDYYRPTNYNNPPITDTREFLKTYYNATIRTLDVKNKISKITLLVRGFDGRIDNSNSGEEYGYISFVIPKEQFEFFKEEVLNLTGKKLLIEQSSSENLLPQKQSIEIQKTQGEKSLLDFKNERAKLIKKYNENTNTHTLRIRMLDQEMISLQNEYPNSSYERKNQINLRLTQIPIEKNNLQIQYENENRDYQKNLSSVNNNIKYTEQNLANIKIQDNNLLENVATVNGTISLDKVSFWEIADIYTPGPLFIWILILAAIASYLRHRAYLRVFI